MNLQSTYGRYPKYGACLRTAVNLAVRDMLLHSAVENGANMLAEGFLFSVAASLIIGETWRSSRNESKRREGINEQLDELGTRLTELSTRVDNLSASVEPRLLEQQQR